MAEFTGERLIPGQVDVDLLNEHLARYAFAARMARGKRVLDAGCGAGYGSAELAHAGLIVTGSDVAAEALEFAREHYRLPNLHFEQATCGALPHPDACFDLVVAFEVIEHLAHWREFLLETRRVLAPGGQFIVSTPNKVYYTESRGAVGANPFHVHEFEFEEFRSELMAIFPHVVLFLENHVGAICFQPYEPGNSVEVRVDSGDPAPQETHFFVAICAHRPQPANPAFVYVPRASNVLRERTRHIALLEQEIARERQRLQAELERSNHWAESLNGELEQRRARIGQLQEELTQVAEGYAAKVKDLEADIRSKAQWAVDIETRLSDQVARQVRELGRALDALHGTERQLEERTHWALRLKQQAEQLQQQLDRYRASRWVRAGRKIGLGPDVPPG